MKNVSMWLVVIGGLNWGLIGVFGPSANVVDTILGSGTTLSRLVYLVIGLSALWATYEMLGMSAKRK